MTQPSLHPSPFDLRQQAKAADHKGQHQVANDLRRKADNQLNQLFNDPARAKLIEQTRAYSPVHTLLHAPSFPRITDNAQFEPDTDIKSLRMYWGTPQHQ